MKYNRGLLSVLPEVAENKKGWPWTEETNPDIYEEQYDYPKISIVTPSYNQAEYIEETIRSVLLQNYPNVEFIIIDGGSNDGTVDILKKYDQWITYWVSEKDGGQSHAINKGFEIATGDLVGWQNSDDIYLESAFLYPARAFLKKPHKDVYYGKIYHIDEKSKIINELHFVPFSFFVLKYHDINIANQGIFFKNRIIKTYPIDTSFFFTMDAEYYFRLASKGVKFCFIPKFLGGFRIQQNSKTSNYLNISKKETNLVRRIYGVKVKDEKPWKNQLIIRKTIAYIYILPYKIIYGGFLYYIKKNFLKVNFHEK